MPRGSKVTYTEKQKRQAEHIEAGYEEKGVSNKEAEKRAWATVNAQDHGGKKDGASTKNNFTKNKTPRTSKSTPTHPRTTKRTTAKRKSKK